MCVIIMCGEFVMCQGEGVSYYEAHLMMGIAGVTAGLEENTVSSYRYHTATATSNIRLLHVCVHPSHCKHHTLTYHTHSPSHYHTLHHSLIIISHTLTFTHHKLSTHNYHTHDYSHHDIIVTTKISNCYEKRTLLWYILCF